MSLRALISRQTSPRSNQVERRSAPRHACLREVVCQAVMAGRDENAPALVENISNTGLRLVLRRCYEPGRVLAVSWRDAHGVTQRTLLAHVIHARNVGDGTWSVGCALGVRLSDDEMKDLL